MDVFSHLYIFLQQFFAIHVFPLHLKRKFPDQTKKIEHKHQLFLLRNLYVLLLQLSKDYEEIGKGNLHMLKTIRHVFRINVDNKNVGEHVGLESSVNNFLGKLELSVKLSYLPMNNISLHRLFKMIITHFMISYLNG